MARDQRKKVKVEFHDDSNDTITVVEVPEQTLITDAAAKAGITIPTLCHHPRLPPTGRCGLCAVSVENAPTPTQLACSTYCKSNKDDDDDPESLTSHVADMKIHVNGTDINGLASAALRRNMEHSMVYREFQKFNQLAPCGSLEIEELGNLIHKTTTDTSSKSITYDPSLCVGCSRCVRACNQMQDMNVIELPVPEIQPTMGLAQAPPCMNTKSGRPLKDTDCISCGQCTLFCPTGAIKEVSHVERVMRALSDPEMVVVLQTAPSTRVTISEMYGGTPGAFSQGQLVRAARASGFQFVFDTNVGADLTIMEEAHELIHRIDIAQNGTLQEKEKKPLPMFTSCCPGWVNFVEQSYPQFLPHLSSCRSPMGMLSSVIRHHWWPKQSKAHPINGKQEVEQSNLFVVAVMPCTAKKDEAARKQLQMPNGKPETDAVLTVREFARLVELRGVAKRSDLHSFLQIPEAGYDNPFGDATGAGAIFGVTGGVMEAALRTAADILSGQDIQDIKYEEVRGLLGIKQSKVELAWSNKEGMKPHPLNVAVCHQMKNVREFLSQIEHGHNTNYHFVEIMTCPGGCIGGGGLPQSKDPDILSKRISGMYSIDEHKVKRKSHENEDLKRLYNDSLREPLSDLSHKLLHTTYFARPRKPLPFRREQRRNSIDHHSCCTEDHHEKLKITIVYGTQSGTSEQAAKDIKADLKKCMKRANVSHPNTQITILVGNAMPPEKLVARACNSFMSIFVTPTYDGYDNCFPDQLRKFWEHLATCDQGAFESMRYAVFGLGSTMYADFEESLFNRAAKELDCKLEELGGARMVSVGLGDDMATRHFRTELEKWTETLLAKVVHELESLDESKDLLNDSKKHGFPKVMLEDKQVNLPDKALGGGSRIFL